MSVNENRRGAAAYDAPRLVGDRNASVEQGAPPRQGELAFPAPGEAPPLVPARMVNEYAYCPRLAYLKYSLLVRAWTVTPAAVGFDPFRGPKRNAVIRHSKRAFVFEPLLTTFLQPLRGPSGRSFHQRHAHVLQLPYRRQLHAARHQPLHDLPHPVSERPLHLRVRQPRRQRPRHPRSESSVAVRPAPAVCGCWARVGGRGARSTGARGAGGRRR